MVAFSQGISHCTENISKFLMKHRKLPLERGFTTISNTLLHCADLIRSVKYIIVNVLYILLLCATVSSVLKLNPINDKILVLKYRHCYVLVFLKFNN